METLAQSISTIAPSTSPTFTVPLVFALAGAGTAAAYGLATGLMVLVALVVSAFARESSSPGSLYVYTRSSLPPVFSALTAWALFFAYVTTSASVMGGFVSFAQQMMPGLRIPALALAAVAAGGAMYVVCRDVEISARLMLWIEATSVALISVVVGATLWRHGLHVDATQFAWRKMSAAGVRQGGMLAIFSFVGFESATTLGSEAREPLKTIPRAVIQSALLAGVLFVVCAYGEVLGFHGAATTLDASGSPMRYLSTQAGMGFVATVIDFGVLVSMFACTLACTIAASRVLLLMAHHGLAHRKLTETHAQHDTPMGASLVAALLAFAPVGVLLVKGASGADVYGWMGTLAVFGFLTAYMMVAIALAAHLKREGRLRLGGLCLSVVATLAMVGAIVGNLYPVPEKPYRYFPYVYAAYLVLAMGWMGLMQGVGSRE